MPESQIQYVGLDVLSPQEQERIRELVGRHLPRYEKLAHNTVSVKIHVKTHAEGGQRKKYSLHLRLSLPSDTLIVDRQADWDLNKALQKSLHALTEKLEKKFRQ